MSISTKTGDNGATGLWGGGRISKASNLIKGIGEVDELNSVLGLIRAELDNTKIDQLLEFIQNSCFVIGANLAALQTKKELRSKKIPEIQILDIDRLDQKIDQLEKKLPELENFILPAGSKIACLFFFSRAVCRRAERSVVSLDNDFLKNSQIFLNRLSDLLFLLARDFNQEQEMIWSNQKS